MQLATVIQLLMYTRLHKYVTHSNGGKFVNTAATSLNAEYNCSGISKFFFLYSLSCIMGWERKQARKNTKKKNFDMPLE
jgi:hypothetical protein